MRVTKIEQIEALVKSLYSLVETREKEISKLKVEQRVLLAQLKAAQNAQVVDYGCESVLLKRA